MTLLNDIQIEDFVYSLDISEADRSNLMFLLKIDKDTLENWYNQLEYDDKIYASELLSTAMCHIIEEKLEESEYHESFNLINKIKGKIQ